MDRYRTLLRSIFGNVHTWCSDTVPEPNSLSANVNTPFLQLYTQEFGHGVSAGVLGHCTGHTPLCAHLSCYLGGNLLLCKPITPLTHTLQNGVASIYAVTYNGVVYTQDVNTITSCASNLRHQCSASTKCEAAFNESQLNHLSIQRRRTFVLGHCWPPVRRSKTDLM